MEFTEYDTRLAAYALIVDDDARVLLSWYRGHDGQGSWTLPGGGVEFDESLEHAAVREVFEETGYHIALGPPLTTHSFRLDANERAGPTTTRPFKSVRVIFAARVTGGSLGTVEVDGTTEYAAWLTLPEVSRAPARADVVDVALEHLDAARAVRL